MERGHAYIPENSGEVYYDISSFPAYGALSGKVVEDLEAGARVEVNQLKRHPADFALWKTDAGHLMQWDPHSDATWSEYLSSSGAAQRPALDPRIGEGFPGWHIECSAMSSRYLGEVFDIHTGGEDNIFPHHECEVAQAVGATGAEYARHWMHARHLLVNGRKMSKSEGTLYTLADLTERGYSAREVRYLLLANHYRQPMNFTLEGLDAARASIARLQNCHDLLVEGESAPAAPALVAEMERVTAALEEGFGAALDDDLNASAALAQLFDFVGHVNRLKPTGQAATRAHAALTACDAVLGVLRAGQSGVIAKEELEAEAGSAPAPAVALELLGAGTLSVEDLKRVALARHAARKARDFATADAIRDGLKALGVQFEDTPSGVRYKLP